METFDQVFMWVSLAVNALVIPLVTSLLKDADPVKVERWGVAKSILTRIFGASTTPSPTTGETKVSVPIFQSAKPKS